MSDESDSTIELNRRRVLGGLGVIGVASAGAGAGTMALLSDSETSSNNTLTAGNIDLTLGSNASPTVDVSNLAPGEGGKKTVKVNNVGDVDGTLDASVKNVRGSSGGSSNKRTFESNVTGYFDYDTHDNVHRLDDYGVDPAVTEVDLSNAGVSIDIELPVELGAASSNDNFSLSFDADNDGTADFQVMGSAGSSRLTYKEFSGGSWGSANYVSNVSGVSGSISGTSVTVDFTSSKLPTDTAFGFGGRVGYEGLESVNGASIPSSNGVNDRILLTPGFSFGPGYNGNASRYTTIDPAEVRTLDDVLDVEVRIDGDDDSGELDKDNDGTLTTQGKPARIVGENPGDGTATLTASGSKYVEVIYRLPYNAGNTVAGQWTEFDLEIDLTQSV